jgi:hypothetical protein
MGRQLTPNRRRWMLGTLVAAIIALAVGVSQGLASASGKGTQQAPVQLHNANCGLDTGKPFIGMARFTLSSSGKMRISFKVNGADPGNYRLELWTGDGTCDEIADVSKFTVDSSGSGSKVSQTTCSDFFGGGCPEGFYFATIQKLDSAGVLLEEGDDSLIVELDL